MSLIKMSHLRHDFHLSIFYIIVTGGVGVVLKLAKMNCCNVSEKGCTKKMTWSTLLCSYV